MNEWATIRLGDIIETNCRSYSSKLPWDYVNYLDTGNITENVIDSIQFIDLKKDKLPSRARRMVRYNNIIYSTVRPNQKHYGIIKDQQDNFLVSTGFTVIEVNAERADADFIYFLLSQDFIVEKLQALAEQSVSAYPSIKSSDIENLQVKLPPIDVQKKISEIFKNITDKIAINTKINQNLEQQTQAIYQQTFITNADPSWNKGHLSDLVIVKYGKDHKKLADGIYPVYGSGGVMRYVERPLYDKESVLIPRKGSLNNVIYVNEPFWSVDTMFYTIMRKPNVAKYVYHFIKAIDLESLNAGSAVPSMTTDILNALEVTIPDSETLQSFEDVVAPMYESIRKNNIQTEKLAEVRDTLLPKLMSGELDVSALDI